MLQQQLASLRGGAAPGRLLPIRSRAAALRANRRRGGRAQVRNLTQSDDQLLLMGAKPLQPFQSARKVPCSSRGSAACRAPKGCPLGRRRGRCLSAAAWILPSPPQTHNLPPRTVLAQALLAAAAQVSAVELPLDFYRLLQVSRVASRESALRAYER